MAKHGFTLYSTARIEREEYIGWLHQLNAVMIPEEGGHMTHAFPKMYAMSGLAYLMRNGSIWL